MGGAGQGRAEVLPTWGSQHPRKLGDSGPTWWSTGWKVPVGFCESGEMWISLKNDWPGPHYNQLSLTPRKFLIEAQLLPLLQLELSNPSPLALRVAAPPYPSTASPALPCSLFYSLALPTLTVHPHPGRPSQMIAKGLSQRKAFT
jgi:hypothetical protein